MAIIELLNTGLTIQTESSDAIWQNGCCWALMYRLGFNNATRIAEMVDYETYGKLPVGNKGVQLVGASENPYEEPGFEAYVARLRRSVMCHFLHTRYGIDTLPADLEMSCRNKPNAWRDVNELADRFMEDEVLSEFAPTWGRSVRRCKEEHGDPYNRIVLPFYRSQGHHYEPRDWEDPEHPGHPRPKPKPAAAPAPTSPAPSAPQPSTPRTAPKFCSNCGSPLSAGAKFCENCGNRIA